MSVIATALKHLIAAGVSGDDLVRAVAEMEAVALAQLAAERPVEDTRSVSARRQARYRERLAERNAERNEASQSVTGDAFVTVDPSPNKSPPHPQKLTPTPHTHEGRAHDAPATPRAWACPTGVDPSHWRDFRANRRKKRLTDTETAYAAQLKLIERFATADWPPGRLVEKAAEKGWGTIVDPTEYEDQGNGHRTANHRQHRARTGSNGLLDAVIDAERQDRFGPRH